MTHPLRQLSLASIRALAQALRNGTVSPPYTALSLAAYVPQAHRAGILSYLAGSEAAGLTRDHVAAILELLAEERASTRAVADRVEFVWSPPDFDEIDARDTAAVVRDLFRQARYSLYITTYALDAGAKAEALFGELATRMDSQPDLEVRLFANVHRPYQDERPAAELLQAFVHRFRADVWPGKRLPEVFFDPRSLAIDHHQHAVLHAKTVIVDHQKVFVTSANFTEAAQDRNIEAGVVIADAELATRLARQLDRLVYLQRFARLAP